MRRALTREETIAAIERRSGANVPVYMAKWWGDGLRAQYGAALDELERAFPEDFAAGWYVEPGYDKSPNGNPEYRMGFLDYTGAQTHSIGRAVTLLPDWDQLDEFLDHFPDPNEPGNFAPAIKAAEGADGRYKLGGWWRLFHERFWGIRGMENLMMDYYDNMEGLKRIGEKLLEYYRVIVDRYADLGYDGIFTSDDLGHQTGPMMSPAVFEELYLPLYKAFIGHAHERGMHVFLHSCGDNTLLMEYLIQAGLDVFHPVQKGCMDMPQTAALYGGRISFLAGVDVQHLLVEATPDQVREEIAQMKRTFNRGGGCLLAMGNGIMPGTPLENIRAALEEMYRPD